VGVSGLTVAAVSASSSDSLPATSLPDPVRSGIDIPDPSPLEHSRHIARWASVRRAVTARRGPSPAAEGVAAIGTRTPEGTENIVQVLGRARRAAGRLWVRARLPVLPNGTAGWVPRRALGGYNVVRTRLVVDRRRLRATLLRDGRPVFVARVGVGRHEYPTPGGRFYIRNKLTRYSSPTYGPLAFGTSARSAVLTDWPAGGFVGIHGTDEPGLIPGRISHGCIRMRNAKILQLGRLMPVGTPVTVR
jgi:L,D-transpeptidase catalytic domain